MPRLFSALEIPFEVGERLAGLRGGLMGARWVDPENYHITLRFAGDIDDPTAHELHSALASISMPSFSLMLDGLGSFGNRKPRSVWAGIAPSDPLLTLQRANERAAQKIGLPPEARNFHPHVTLARMRNGKAP
ncbi:MAG: RNA 2',3'-cyclic phosphodiesterase, partial [Pirellulales bacterium]|nr:RNA 2',3'-cyclic phosphodiesterase [Pirellulales bacterium]